MRLFNLVVVMVFLAGNSSATNDCPLHAAHMGEASRTEHLVERGDQAMGFVQALTTHHFRLRADGGAIEVTADDETDIENVKGIRTHLNEIAVRFQQGDFDLPEQIHQMEVPGSEVMQKRASKISYLFEDMKRGGRVVIRTKDAKALAAIHTFLRFQIKDHETGDATGVGDRGQ